MHIQVIDQVILTDETASISGGLFPDDLDTTALALRALKPSSARAISLVLNLMAEYVNSDGTFQVSHQIPGTVRVMTESFFTLTSTADVFRPRQDSSRPNCQRKRSRLFLLL